LQQKGAPLPPAAAIFVLTATAPVASISKYPPPAPPTRDAFTAFGQASIEMAHGIFALLSGHQAKVFAVAIPAEVRSQASHQPDEFLRKDLAFLFERYFRFLEEEHEMGLLVMDETDITSDRRLVKRIESYFEKTKTGRWRSSRILPSPLFVSSEMTKCAASLALECGGG
jgi:hypothetical protein